MQVRDYFILTIIWGFSPLRARKTIELCGLDSLTGLQPQCVSRSKLNLRGRNLLQSKAAAATPTIPRDTIFCQSTVPTYYVSPVAQLLFFAIVFVQMGSTFAPQDDNLRRWAHYRPSTIPIG